MTISILIQTEIVQRLRFIRDRDDAVLDIDKILEDIIVYKRDSLKVLEDLRSRLEPVRGYSQQQEPQSIQVANNIIPAPLTSSHSNTLPDTNHIGTDHPISPAGESGFFAIKRPSLLRSHSKEKKPEPTTSDISPDKDFSVPSVVELPETPYSHFDPNQNIEPSFQADYLAVPAPLFSNDDDSTDGRYSDKILVYELPDTSPASPISAPSPPISAPSPTSHSAEPMSLLSTLPDRTSIVSTSTEGGGFFSHHRFSHSSSILDRMSTVSSRTSAHSRPMSTLDSAPHSPISAPSIPGKLHACPTGFCKGAWNTRTEPKKGLSLATVPVGIYGRKQVWQCKHCTFHGETPGGKSFDTRVITDEATEIRYRWMFLAKSHAKTKNSTSSFGCVFCADLGMGTAMYGQIPTLMGHIATDHREMTANMAEMSKCILGGGVHGDDWDILIPFGVERI
jgi:hypothetical protein